MKHIITVKLIFRKFLICFGHINDAEKSKIEHKLEYWGSFTENKCKNRQKSPVDVFTQILNQTILHLIRYYKS